MFTAVAANKTVPVRVLGAPAGQSSALQSQILEGLKKNWSYLNTSFVPASGPAGQGAELVFAFNAGTGSGDTICAGKGAAGGAPITTVSGAFCQGITLTEIHAVIPQARAATDANLQHAISYLTWQVIPAPETSKSLGDRR